MSENEFLNLIKQITGESVDNQVSLRSNGLDSLDIVDLLITLEDEYKITISESEIHGNMTPTELYLLVTKKTEQ